MNDGYKMDTKNARKKARRHNGKELLGKMEIKTTITIAKNCGE